MSILQIFSKAGHFKAMGCYAGMSIAQGGPGFPILADALFRYMTTGQTTGIKVPSEHLPLQLQSVVAEVLGYKFLYLQYML